MEKDYTVKIEDGRIMFMTSYWNEFGEKIQVANIISKERLIEIGNNVSDALSKLSQAEVIKSVCDHNWEEWEDANCNARWRCTRCKEVI
jgi:hypothetical protein